MKRLSLSRVSSFVILSDSLVGVEVVLEGVVVGDAPVMNAGGTSVVVTGMIVVVIVMIVVVTGMIVVVTGMIAVVIGMIVVVTGMIVVVIGMIVVVTEMIAVVTGMIAVVTGMIAVVTGMIAGMIVVVGSVGPRELVIVQTSMLKMKRTFLPLELSVPEIK